MHNPSLRRKMATLVEERALFHFLITPGREVLVFQELANALGTGPTIPRGDIWPTS